MNDKQLKEQVAADPFHQGANDHEEFKGFPRDRRTEPRREVRGMSQREIAEAAARVNGLRFN